MSLLEVFGIAFESEGADEVKEDIKDLEKSTQQLLKTFASGAAYMMVFKSLVSRALNFSQEGEQLSLLADKAGVSTEAIERMGIALRNYGGSASSASSTLAKLNSMMQDAKFGKKNGLTNAALTYGLNLGANSPEQMLMNIAKRMETLGTSAQNDLGKKLGLDPATLALVKKGVAGVREELQKAESLRIFNEQDIKRSQILQREYREWQQRLDQIASIIARWVTPAVTRLFHIANVFLEYLNRHQNIIKYGFLSIITLVGILGAAFSPVITAVVAVGAAIGLLIDDFIAFKEGGKSLIDWENGLWKVVAVLTVIAGIVAVINGSWIAIAGVIAGLAYLFAKAGEALEKWILKGIEKIMGFDWSKLNPLNWFKDKEGKDPAQEGANYLEGTNTPLNETSSQTISNANTNNSTKTDVRIDKVEIQTQARDGQGVANAMNNYASGITAEYATGAY